MDRREGPLRQHALETCLRPTDRPGQVYLRCEGGLDDKQGVLLLVKLRDGFTFNGPIPVSAAGSWHRDEYSISHVSPLPTIDNTTPLLLSTVTPENVGVGTLPGSHFYVHVYFDLTKSEPPSTAYAPSATLIAIDEEKETLSQLKGKALREHICKELPMPHCRNLEFVCKVARLRLEALHTAREHDKSFELNASCDYLQSGLVDRLRGPHFAQRRNELSSELTALGSQNTPRKRSRGTERSMPPDASSWRPSEGDNVKYRDDEGTSRIVTVGRVDEWDATGQCEIWWIRNTTRDKLAHTNFRPLKKEEVQQLSLGDELLYNGYEVTLACDPQQAEFQNDDHLDIKITRFTTKVSRE